MGRPAGRLYVHFRSGAWYAYDGVPPALVLDLLTAPSLGRFLRDRIIPERKAWRVDMTHVLVE